MVRAFEFVQKQFCFLRGRSQCLDLPHGQLPLADRDNYKVSRYLITFVSSTSVEPKRPRVYIVELNKIQTDFVFLLAQLGPLNSDIPASINFPIFAARVMRNGAVFSKPNGYCLSRTDILRSIQCNVCYPYITGYRAAGRLCGRQNCLDIERCVGNERTQMVSFAKYHTDSMKYLNYKMKYMFSNNSCY